MANPVVKAIANEGLDFFNNLRAQQQTTWGENQTALNMLQKAWAPVLQTGVVPYGYSAGLDSLLQANVLQTAGTATSNAINAEALRQKQESGGANVLPTGANEAINAEILAKGQQSAATGLQQEKVAGYEQGLQNLEGGTQAELGIMGNESPTKAASVTTAQGGLAENAGAEEFKENQETGSPFAIMGEIGQGIGLAKQIIPFLPTGGGGGDGAASSDATTNAEGSFLASGGSFHRGGIVPGKPGEEKWIKVLAGEKVIPVSKVKRKKSLLSQTLAKD